MSLSNQLIEAIEANDVGAAKALIGKMKELAAHYAKLNENEADEFKKQFPDATPLAKRKIPQEDTLSGHALDGEKFAGQRALGLAAASGKNDFVRLLLSEGVDVDSRKEGEDTPIMLAVAAGHIETVRVLRQAGANPHPVNAKNQDVIFVLVSKTGSEKSDEERANLLRVLLDPQTVPLPKEQKFSGVGDGETKTTSLALVHTPQLPLIDFTKQYRIKKEKDVGLDKDKQFTALDIAVDNKFPSVVEFLLTNQALLKTVVTSRHLWSRLGNSTLLSFAAFYGRTQIIEIFLKKVGDQITSANLHAALFLAVQADTSETVMALLRHPKALEIDFELPNLEFKHNVNGHILKYENPAKNLIESFRKAKQFKLTPLEFAVFVNKPDELAKLLESKDVDLLNIYKGWPDGRSHCALSYAVQEGYTECVKILAKKIYKFTDLEFAVFTQDSVALEKAIKELQANPGAEAKDPNKLLNAICGNSKKWPNCSVNRYPLTWAIEHCDNIEIAKQLFNAVRDSISKEILHGFLNFAADRKKTELVKFFLEHPLVEKIQFDEKDVPGRLTSEINTDAAKPIKAYWYKKQLTAFEKSVYENSAEAEAFLKTEQKTNEVTESKLATATDILQYKKWPNDEDHCPLSWVVGQGNAKLAGLMLDKVKPEQLDEKTLNQVLTKAIEKNLVGVVQRLLSHPLIDKLTALTEKMSKVVDAETTEAGRLFKAPLLKKQYNWTDLDYAVFSNQVGKVTELLRAQSKINDLLTLPKAWPKFNDPLLLDDGLFGLLNITAYQGYIGILTAFLEAGKGQLTQKSLTNALVFACLKPQGECFKLLLTALENVTDDLDAADARGQRPSTYCKNKPELKKLFEDAIEKKRQVREQKEQQEKLHLEKVKQEREKEPKLAKSYLLKMIEARKDLILDGGTGHLLGLVQNKEPEAKKSVNVRKEDANGGTEMGANTGSNAVLESKSLANSLSAPSSEAATNKNYTQLCTLLANFISVEQRTYKNAVQVYGLIKNPDLLQRLAKDPDRQFLPRALAMLVIAEVDQDPAGQSHKANTTLKDIAPMTHDLWEKIKSMHLWNALILPCTSDGHYVMHYVTQGDNEKVAKLMITAFTSIAPDTLLGDGKQWAKIGKPVAKRKGIETVLSNQEKAKRETLADLWHYYLHTQNGLKSHTKDVRAERIARRYVAVCEILKMLWQGEAQGVQRGEGSEIFTVNVMQLIQDLKSILGQETTIKGFASGLKSLTSIFGSKEASTSKGKADRILEGLSSYSIEDLKQQAGELRRYLVAQYPNICQELKEKWKVDLIAMTTAEVAAKATVVEVTPKAAAVESKSDSIQQAMAFMALMWSEEKDKSNGATVNAGESMSKSGSANGPGPVNFSPQAGSKSSLVADTSSAGVNHHAATISTPGLATVNGNTNYPQPNL